MKTFKIDKDNSIYIKKHPIINFLGKAFLLICIIISLFIIGFSSIYLSAPVEGLSMQPTLNANGNEKNDIVYINKFAKYNYNDIIVVEKPPEIDDVKYIIKRIIGLPGDKINIIKDIQTNEIYVYRNGEKLIEPYILGNKTVNNVIIHNTKENGMQATLYNFEKLRNATLNNPNNYKHIHFNENNELVLSDNQIFILGDNRSNSTDSAKSGPFNIDNIIGRVDYIIPNNISPFLFFLNHFTGIKLYK